MPLRGKSSWTRRLVEHWRGRLCGHSSVYDCGGWCVEGRVIGGVKAGVVGGVEGTGAVVAVGEALRTHAAASHQPWGTRWRAGLIEGHLLWCGVWLWWGDWIICAAGLLVASDRWVIHSAPVDYSWFIIWILAAAVGALIDRRIIAPVRHIFIVSAPTWGFTTVSGIIILVKCGVVGFCESRLVSRIRGIHWGMKLWGVDQSCTRVLLHYFFCVLQELGTSTSEWADCKQLTPNKQRRLRKV